MSLPECNGCRAPLRHTFVDLGPSPLANALIQPVDSRRMEPFFPLHTFVCEGCFLVQLPEAVSRESLFGDYAYFSSYSTSWLAHARRYCDEVVRRFRLDSSRRVVEIASNDGYLLKNFVPLGIPVLGVEPAANVAEAARGAGIPTEVAFFGEATAKKLLADGGPADLIIGNNVLAHVPDLNDFVSGVAALLARGGAATFEFPHLLRLMLENQFDTIYHEHFSYLSLTTVEQLFANHGLSLFDVEELPTHGGSLRLYACHREAPPESTSPRVGDLRQRESAAGLTRLATYHEFAERVATTKRRLLRVLLDLKEEGAQVVGYGAPGKGTVLLNYCGIRTDVVDYTVDRSPHKQGFLMPGVRIPIRPPEAIAETRPDVILILPWNLRDEIIEQLSFVRDWGARFLVPIPEPILLR